MGGLFFSNKQALKPSFLLCQWRVHAWERACIGDPWQGHSLAYTLCASLTQGRLNIQATWLLKLVM
eukprot:937169-Pelagomonas_calceolata.AAC.7